MIRWRFVVTRLLILLAILMLARWGMAPLVRYASIQVLQSSVGSRAEVAQARVGLFPPRLQLRDVQVADPREGKQLVNAFEAESIDLMIDGEALLQRRFVARDGRIRGVRIGGARTSSGHLAVTPAPAPSSPSFLGPFLKTLGQSAREQTEAFTNDLQTVQRSREIRARWAADYASLVKRAQTLEDEIRQIRDQATGIDNPLRDLPRLQATIRRAEGIAQESLALRRTMDAMPGRIHADWNALEQAKQNDLARVNEYLPVEVEGIQDIGPDLVRTMVRGQLSRARGYLATAKQIAAWTVTSPETERLRGRDVPLHRSPLPPGLLLRRSELSGLLTVDGETFTMTGILENVTPQKERLTEPLRARLRLEGPRVARIDFKRFHNEQKAGEPVRDQVTVHWPSLPVAKTQWGDAEEAALAIEGGELELYVQIESRGEALSGKLISRQTDTRFTLQCDSSAEKLAITRAFQQSLQEIDRVEIRADFRGTGNDLEIAMSTSLSEALSRGLRGAAAAQLEESKALLTQRVATIHREQMQELQAWLNKQHGEATERFAETSRRIASVRDKLVAELPKVGGYSQRIGSLLNGLK